MPSALDLVASRVHLPLMRLGMCLDCEACFEIGVEACPACGSKTWMALARFLETARGERMVQSVDSLRPGSRGTTPRTDARHYIIVARDREALYHHFRESFSGNTTVEVMLDRRQADKSSSADKAKDQRGGDRRWRAIGEQLRVLGWAVVRVNGAAAQSAQSKADGAERSVPAAPETTGDAAQTQ